MIKALKTGGEYDWEAYEEVLAGESNFRFLYKNSDEKRLTNCPYAGTPAPDVTYYTNPNVRSYYRVALGGCTSGVIWSGSKSGGANRFADALFVLARSSPPDVAQDPDFQKVVQQYRAAGGQAQLTEGVRAHRVAAEAAVREKRFEDAVNEYGEGLKLAPWWPQGHFNRGLILAELGAYGAAGREMKRYLLLEPDAQNARQVQDKIYEWQAKVK